MYNAVGQVPVVHTLPEYEQVCGVTSLADEVYVLRRVQNVYLAFGMEEAQDHTVEEYDVINYGLQRRLTMSLRGVTDMTSCEHYRCVYIADSGKCIHRLDVQGAFTRWAVNDRPWGISVNATHNLLVTCGLCVRKIKEFSSHGDLLRELTLPDYVVSPHHAIQSRNGDFIVSHGDYHDPVHRVCKISANGHIIQSHGGQRGSDIGQYYVPVHLAVDNNEFVLVADVINRRVTLLSPTLGYVSQVVSRDDLKWRPDRLCLDIHRHLYVADNEWKAGKYTPGRVVVFSI